MPWVTEKIGFYKYLPTLVVQSSAQINNTLKILPPGARICDIGSGGRKITADTFTIDILQCGNTDLICDAHKINLPDNSFDCVFCTGLLEHVKDPDMVIDEIYRILKPMGLVHIEVPFIQGYHPDPTDYRRWTLEGIKLVCSLHSFEEIKSGVSSGSSSALGWVAHDWLLSIFGTGFIGSVVDILSRFIMFPLKYLDFLIPEKRAVLVPCVVYVIGRKKDKKVITPGDRS